MEAALQLRAQLSTAGRRVLLRHALVGGMQGEYADAWRLQRLARG